MQCIVNDPLYKDDIRFVAELPLPWQLLNNATVVITGATGQIGSFLTDVLLYKNKVGTCHCKIIALGRHTDTILKRFEYTDSTNLLKPVKWSFSDSTPPHIDDPIDYIIHLASNTHPASYATDPIGTIEGNVLATNNLLKLAVAAKAKRFLFASSNEIYGENRGDTEFFDEHYCGYIDCNTLRAGYPESKRCGEALCQAYIQQCELDCVIARLTRTYGPTILSSDTKAISQFIKNARAGEDIVLKSAGSQFYSYLYVADSVSGLLTVLFKGITGESYNIADTASDVTLKDLATHIANSVARKVIFSTPSDTEKMGFSKATKARLASDKIKSLGWSPRYDISTGIKRTLSIKS